MRFFFQVLSGSTAAKSGSKKLRARLQQAYGNRRPTEFQWPEEDAINMNRSQARMIEPRHKAICRYYFRNANLFWAAETGKICFQQLLSQLTFNVLNNTLAESESVSNQCSWSKELGHGRRLPVVTWDLWVQNDLCRFEEPKLIGKQSHSESSPKKVYCNSSSTNSIRIQSFRPSLGFHGIPIKTLWIVTW